MRQPGPYGWISQFYTGYFFLYGVYLPFWALWFQDQGVSAGDIGLLLGIAFATRCVANLVITPRIHRLEHLVPALRLLSVLALLFLVFHMFAGSSFWMLALATILLNACIGPITPISDSLTNYYSRLKLLDYGRTRLWGSIAFIAGSTVVGFMVARFGNDMIVYTAMFGTLVSILFAMRRINPMPVTEAGASMARPRLSRLARDPGVIKFILLVSLIQGSHAAYYALSSIHWQSAGHSEDLIGYLWSLGVVAEVLVFALSKRLFAGWSLRTLFVVASLGVILRWGLTASTTDVFALVLIQLLHGVTFAMAHIAAIQYIQQERTNKIVALQALYNAIPMGLVMAAVTSFSGWGYENWGAMVFWVMALMGLLSLGIRVTPASERDEPGQEGEAEVARVEG